MLHLHFIWGSGTGIKYSLYRSKDCHRHCDIIIFLQIGSILLKLCRNTHLERLLERFYTFCSLLNLKFLRNILNDHLYFINNYHYKFHISRPFSKIKVALLERFLPLHPLWGSDTDIRHSFVGAKTVTIILTSILNIK